jgi:hypothetical protein
LFEHATKPVRQSSALKRTFMIILLVRSHRRERHF